MAQFDISRVEDYFKAKKRSNASSKLKFIGKRKESIEKAKLQKETIKKPLISIQDDLDYLEHVLNSDLPSSLSKSQRKDENEMVGIRKYKFPPKLESKFVSLYRNKNPCHD